FSKLYLNGLQSIGIQISVANNSVENGDAEQQNSMLKNHFIPTINPYPVMNIDQKKRRMLGCYTRQSKQTKLGWLSTVEFEQKWHGKENRPIIKLHDFEN